MEENFKENWGKILIDVRDRVSVPHFLTYFQSTFIKKIEGNTIFVGSPIYSAKNWIETNATQKLIRATQKYYPTVEKVEIIIDNTILKDDPRSINTKEIVKTKKPKPVIKNLTLRNDLTLDNFVVGPENRLAHAATCAASKRPGESYNPIFIYGDVGLGKTHLLMGVGNEIGKLYPEKNIVFSTSENFMNEYVQSVHGGKKESFKRKFKNVDVLLIDDVQFLAGRERTQIELYNIFNMMYDSKRQIAISSDRPPKELTELHDRLRSRFEWGMIVDVQMPDFETRVAILQEKCRIRGVFISPEVLNFIAENVRDSVRELEGVLMQAVALYELENVSPTVQNVSKILKKVNKNNELVGMRNFREDVEIHKGEDVIGFVADYYEISPEEMLSESRQKEFLRPRQIAMYIIKTELDESLEKIGRIFGGKKHTTIRHAVKKIQDDMKKNRHLLREINALRREMGFR